MPRYQFAPRGTHCLNFENARAAVAAYGGTTVRVCSPIMTEASRTYAGKHRIWRGTNQPKTLSFTLPDDDTAAMVETQYGYHLAFVEIRPEIF